MVEIIYSDPGVSTTAAKFLPIIGLEGPKSIHRVPVDLKPGDKIVQISLDALENLLVRQGSFAVTKENSHFPDGSVWSALGIRTHGITRLLSKLVIPPPKDAVVFPINTDRPNPVTAIYAFF